MIDNKFLEEESEKLMNDEMDPMEYVDIYNAVVEKESKDEDYGFRYHEHI